MKNEELENRKHEKKQIVKFFILVISLFIGLLLSIFIYYNIQMCLMDEVKSHHVKMSQKFQMLYIEDKEKHFNRIGVINLKESTDIIDSNKNPVHAITLYLQEEFAEEYSDWNFKNAEKYSLSVTVHTPDNMKNFAHTKEIFITNEDYPFYKEGWHISGRYVCINDSEFESLVHLNCIQANKSTVFNKETKTTETKFLEF